MKNNSKLLIISVLLVNTYLGYAQKNNNPKLVVGIVVDQMRAEYLYRFQDNYTENGFKRLIREGFHVKNIHYNYVPTSTGPGHASIYTGTTPTNHGVIANYWYSKKLKRNIYCAEDTLVQTINQNIKEKSISRSPNNLLATTITDELKLYSNNRSKVIGLSLKDRGAIFPSGHLADYAFWYNSEDGNFVTSSYYSNNLPNWLLEFNNKKLSDSLLTLSWTPLLSISKYKNSQIDEAKFEKTYKGKTTSMFPYNLKNMREENGDFLLLPETPFGNTLLTELAITTIKKENLGNRQEIDFLTISYSSTDYIGHHFGIRSKELEDTYIRLDREIEKLLEVLDTELGSDNYVLFLTADHGASDNPDFLVENRLPGKFYSPEKIKENLNNFLSNEFGKADYVEHIDKLQIYFKESNIPKNKIQEKAILFLKDIEGVREVFVPSTQQMGVNNHWTDFVREGYHYGNSGDIVMHFNSGWMQKREYGASHGTAYTSDTHVPLLWFGKNIPQGNSVKLHSITEIAPTISMLLNIPLPSSSNKNVIEELFD